MSDRKIKIDTGDHLIVISNRYETLAVVNDILTGLWFLSGSILFLYDNTTKLAVVFFIAGSVELLIRPTIRLLRNLHVKKLGSPCATTDGSGGSGAA